jgi:hypothetical protein
LIRGGFQKQPCFWSPLRDALLRRAPQDEVRGGTTIFDGALRMRAGRGGVLGRVEQSRIRRLVPDEHPVAPAPAAVHGRERFAEGEDAVVAVEVEAADRVGIAHRAVMGIVEQEGEAAAAAARPADPGDEVRLVPLVGQDRVGAVQRGVEVERGVENGRGQVRVRSQGGGEARLAVIAQEVLDAPGAVRLVGRDPVAGRGQLPQHAAQEMGVAVVPAGAEGVGEDDDLHARASWKVGGRSGR